MPLYPQKRQSSVPTCLLSAATMVVTGLIVMPAAYQNTVVNPPQDILMNYTRQSFAWEFGQQLDQSKLNALWGFMICASGIAAIPCALIMPWLTEKFGVKIVLFIFGSLANILCAGFECLAKYTDIFEFFIIGQCFGPGFGWTFAFGLAPVYLAECSPSHLRGMTGTMVSFGFFVGILLSFILGISALLGTEALWGIYMILTAAPAIIAIALYFWFPDSPKYIYIKQENPEKAKKVLKQLYGKSCKTMEIFKEYDDEANMSSVECTLREVLTERHLRTPLIISVVAQVFTFCCGPMVVMGYSTLIFNQFLDAFQSQIGTVLIAAPLPFLSIGASIAMEKFGRRPLLLLCGIAMQVALAIYVIFGLIYEHTGATWAVYVAVAGVALNMWISPFGPLSIGLFLVSEVTPQASRTMSSAACVVFSMITYVILNFLFPILQGIVGAWVVLILLIVPSILCLIYLHLKLPETKDRSINEIMNQWITPAVKASIAYERRMSMIIAGKTDSVRGGRRVSLADDALEPPPGYVRRASCKIADLEGMAVRKLSGMTGASPPNGEAGPGAQPWNASSFHRASAKVHPTVSTIAESAEGEDETEMGSRKNSDNTLDTSIESESENNRPVRLVERF